MLAGVHQPHSMGGPFISSSPWSNNTENSLPSLLSPSLSIPPLDLFSNNTGSSSFFPHPLLFGYPDKSTQPPPAYKTDSPLYWGNLLPSQPTSPASSTEDVYKLQKKMFNLAVHAPEPLRRKRNGEVPQRVTTAFSKKVFVGGLPITLPRTYVESIFGRFGEVNVDWPRPSTVEGKGKSTSSSAMNSYVFLVYSRMESVERLLDACQHTNGKYWFTIKVGTLNKTAQIRPWFLRDTNYIPDPMAIVDVRNTVFVGGVPRPATAQQLAELLEKNFGKVLFASIDIDPEQQYPKGAGRVIFEKKLSYVNAIRGRFLKMDAQERHNKEIEIKPYVLEGQRCDECGNKNSSRRYADYFCADPSCLQYYCIGCFDRMHAEPRRANHKIVVREGERTRELLEPPHRHSQTNTSSSSLEDEMLRSMDRYLYGFHY